MVEMTRAEKKAYRQMVWKALLRGFTWQPLPSAKELLTEFYERVRKIEAKG